jgi:hypothetical protein
LTAKYKSRGRGITQLPDFLVVGPPRTGTTWLWSPRLTRSIAEREGGGYVPLGRLRFRLAEPVRKIL